MEQVLYNAILAAIDANIIAEHHKATNDSDSGIVIMGKHNCTDAIMIIIKEVVSAVQAPPISKETLLAVREGSMSNDRLREALLYYTPLEKLLRAHQVIDNTYELVWLDVYHKLEKLQAFWRYRNEKHQWEHVQNQITFDITGKSL